jgi:hypothetical protein
VAADTWQPEAIEKRLWTAAGALRRPSSTNRAPAHAKRQKIRAPVSGAMALLLYVARFAMLLAGQPLAFTLGSTAPATRLPGVT